MKKHLGFIIPFMIVPFLTSCGGNEKINLQYGQMASNDVTYIDYQSLSEKISSKQTFIAVVYSQSCACWSVFHTILNQYIEENHILVYAVNYKNFHSDNGTALDTFGLNIESGYDTFAIFKKGELKINLKSGSEKLFEKSESFTSFMDENVILPKAFYISLEEVNKLYASEETFALYFARSNCSDCQYFDRHVLDDYEINNNLYILDCETIGIRVYDEDGNLTEESQTAWNQFKKNYYLADEQNPDFGYGSGYVPTLLLMQGNGYGNTPTILSGSVYFNDSISSDENGYYVSSSYYTDERVAKLKYEADVIQGLRLSEDDISSIEYKGETYTFWLNDSAAEYHNKNVKSFLEYALPKVTHTGFITEE